jgi:hypothetical protein
MFHREGEEGWALSYLSYNQSTIVLVGRVTILVESPIDISIMICCGLESLLRFGGY